MNTFFFENCFKIHIAAIVIHKFYVKRVMDYESLRDCTSKTSHRVIKFNLLPNLKK